MRGLRGIVFGEILFISVFISVAAGSAAAEPVKSQMKSEGFLAPGDLPNSLILLPAPPVAGSAGYAADEEQYRVTRALRGTPRWELSRQDADIDFPEAAETFSCAVEAPITEKETPRLYDLLRRTKADAYRAAGKAKKHYRRVRPFVVNKESTCTPFQEIFLARSPSFPSSHATTGWAWALILAEIAPDRADAVLARGLAFGQSRVICGVHWQSDVTAGRIVGAGVVAVLHSDPAFRAQVEEARKELAAARSRKLKPARDCGGEAAALKVGTPGKLPEEKNRGVRKKPYG